MKKLILTLLIGGFMMTGAFAKTAFVYFSATGTTERMAKNAAKEMGADIFEIQPVHKYTAADLDWHDKKSLSSIECNDPKSRPAIKAVVSTLRQAQGPWLLFISVRQEQQNAWQKRPLKKWELIFLKSSPFTNIPPLT